MYKITSNHEKFVLVIIIHKLISRHSQKNEKMVDISTCGFFRRRDLETGPPSMGAWPGLDLLPWERDLNVTSSHGSGTWNGNLLWLEQDLEWDLLRPAGSRTSKWPPPMGAGPGTGPPPMGTWPGRELLPWEQDLKRDILPYTGADPWTRPRKGSPFMGACALEQIFLRFLVTLNT